MPFSSFNHVYGLFATISSALVGFDVAQDYLADRFKIKVQYFLNLLEKYKTILIDIKNDLKGYIDDISEHNNRRIPAFISKLDKEVDKIQKELDRQTTKPTTSPITEKGKLLTKTDRLKDNLSSDFLLRSPEDEKELAKMLASNLAVFSFLFCLMLLIIAGFQDLSAVNVQSIKDDFCLRMIADFELLLAFFILVLFVLYFFKPSRDFVEGSSYGRILFLFLGLTFVSYLLACTPPHYSGTKLYFLETIHPTRIYAASFVIGLLPFVGLLYRYFIYLIALYFKTRIRLFFIALRLERMKKMLVKETLE